MVEFKSVTIRTFILNGNFFIKMIDWATFSQKKRDCVNIDFFSRFR